MQPSYMILFNFILELPTAGDTSNDDIEQMSSNFQKWLLAVEHMIFLLSETTVCQQDGVNHSMYLVQLFVGEMFSPF